MNIFGLNKKKRVNTIIQMYLVKSITNVFLMTKKDKYEYQDWYSQIQIQIIIIVTH